MNDFFNCLHSFVILADCSLDLSKSSDRRTIPEAEILEHVEKLESFFECPLVFRDDSSCITDLTVSGQILFGESSSFMMNTPRLFRLVTRQTILPPVAAR